MQDTRQKPSSEKVLGQLWKNCIPHVKFRAYKAVDGKCGMCASLSGTRSCLTDAESREAVTLLHAMHSMYMGELLSYYTRRHEALQ